MSIPIVVNIKVTGGEYADTEWTGRLDHAPATLIHPEGLGDHSAEEANQLRHGIEVLLKCLGRFTISGGDWTLHVVRTPEPEGPEATEAPEGPLKEEP